MWLDTTTKSLEIVLAGAVTTNQLAWVADYGEVASDNSTSAPKNSDGATNGATAVTLVAAPGASLVREVLHLAVFNADTAAAVATIRLNDNSTLRTLQKVTLQTGETLTYTTGRGWYVLDANGAMKTTPGVIQLTSSDNSLTVSPTSGAVVATLNMAHPNIWTAQQTFSTVAPVFSTMSNTAVLFAGASGLLSQDLTNFFYDSAHTTLTVSTYRIGTSAVHKTLNVAFADGVANQKADLYFGDFVGWLEITVTSDYVYANAMGYVTKRFGFGGNGGTIYKAASRYTDVAGNTPTHFSLSDISWDATNSRWRVQIVHNTSNGNTAFILIRALSTAQNYTNSIRDCALSAVYTTDTTVWPTPVISLAAGAGIPAGGSTVAAKLGGAIFDHYADAGNTTTTETDLYSDTIAASTLGTNGDKLNAEYAGAFVSSATATRQVRAYFGGTLIFDSGAITIAVGADAWDLCVTIIRESSTVVRCVASMTTTGATITAFVNYTRITGLTLSASNILKVTGTAAGAGAATNDIVAKFGTGSWLSAA